MSKPRPVTVCQVLALPVVRRAIPEVLAGADALDREIRWVHSSEVSNIASLLEGGELLLTTGMGVGRGAAAQRRLVGELAERGVSAMAIELGTALTNIPVALIEAARRHDLCLIAFHREVRFVEVTEAVHREIIDQGGELLRRGEALHRRFTALMLGGAGVPDVLTELSSFVGNPVFLERAGGGLAYHSCHTSDDETVLSAWTAFERDLTSAPAALQERVPIGGEGSWGRLVALAVDSDLEAQDRIAVERAVGLIALALMRNQEEKALTARQRGDFLAGLTRSRAGDAEISARAASLGFSGGRGGTKLPVAISLSDPSSEGPTDPAWVAVSIDLLEDLARRDVPVLAGDGDHGELLLMIGLRVPGDRVRIAELVADVLRHAVDRRLQQRPPTVCVGAAVERWLDAGAALEEAIAALPAAAEGSPTPWHDVAAPSTDRLLFSLRDRPELKRFADLRLQALTRRDRHSRGDLVETLAVYCDHAGRKAETAAALGIKRQTLYHRLNRIEAATEADLSDGETLLSMHLALRARRYLPDY